VLNHYTQTDWFCHPLALIFSLFWISRIMGLVKG
jgi:hypothetical protein